MHKSILYRHGFPNSRYSYLMASDRKGYNLPYRDIVKVNCTLGSLIPRSSHPSTVILWGKAK